MKLIDLTQGKQAKIDEEDYDWLNSRSWQVLKDRSGYFYARTNRKKEDNPDWPSGIYMHRLIIAKHKGRNITGNWIVDHVNGDSLDNRKSNLRACTYDQNRANHTKPPKGEIPFYGVCFHKTKGSYMAQIGEDQRFLGYFKTAEAAARAYNKAAIEKYGKYATLNEGVEE